MQIARLLLNTAVAWSAQQVTRSGRPSPTRCCTQC
jgi:hypothetical protein